MRGDDGDPPEPKGWKQPGSAPDLVDHHQPAQGIESQQRIGQAGHVTVVLQVEVCRGTAGRQRARQGRLADLARADQRDDGERAQQPLQLGAVLIPCEHRTDYP